MVRQQQSKKLKTVAWGIAVFALVASAAAPEAGAPGLVFSHAEHLDRDPKASCVQCHEPANIRPGAPALKGERCQFCHDEKLRYRPRLAPPLVQARFRHDAHKAELSCRDCHVKAKTARGGEVEIKVEFTRPLVSEACFGCHAQRAKAPRPQQCKSCHSANRRRTPPRNHDGRIWRYSHGETALLGAFGMHGQSCKDCHRESSCRSCHQVERPRDHNALWRMRTHGTAAAWDRTRCKTCHQTGQCISCHQTTRPINHRGAWRATHSLVAGGRLDARCLTCHRPNYCIDCHRGGG